MVDGTGSRTTGAANDMITTNGASCAGGPPPGAPIPGPLIPGIAAGGVMDPGGVELPCMPGCICAGYNGMTCAT